MGMGVMGMRIKIVPMQLSIIYSRRYAAPPNPHYISQTTHKMRVSHTLIITRSFSYIITQ